MSSGQIAGISVSAFFLLLILVGGPVFQQHLKASEDSCVDTARGEVVEGRYGLEVRDDTGSFFSPEPDDYGWCEESTYAVDVSPEFATEMLYEIRELSIDHSNDRCTYEGRGGHIHQDPCIKSSLDAEQREAVRGQAEAMARQAVPGLPEAVAVDIRQVVSPGSAVEYMSTGNLP